MIPFQRFEAAKMKRFVDRYSSPFTFRRSVLNAYKEPTDDALEVCTIKGVYHEAKYTHLKETESGGGSYVTKMEPMILCMKNELSDMIQTDDIVEVNGRTNIVTRIKDINNAGFAYDISLRLIDNGSDA